MTAEPTTEAAGPLPGRPSLLIRNGYVMTMDAAGDLTDADVHIEDGRIVAVGPGLSAPGAEVIDGRGFIVMPGLVDTHWHMWTSLLRNMSSHRNCGYSCLLSSLAPAYTAADMYLGVLLAATEAVSSGITTLHDWCHNLPTFEYAEAGLKALSDAGVRGRFSYGATFGTPGTEAMDISQLQRLSANWSSFSNEGLLTPGMAWRGAVLVHYKPDKTLGLLPAPEHVWRTEYDAARSLDLPISIHANLAEVDAGHIAELDRLGLLYSDMQVIHALSASKAEIEAMAAAGASLSAAPVAAMRAGLGLPRILDFSEAGVKVGLSIDSLPFAGNADMFALMKLAEMAEITARRNEFAIPARRLIEMATIEGAQTLGLSDRTGSLVAGKRADVIMVDTRHINLTPFTYADHMLVDAAQPMNVDTVIIDGRILKRGGRLTAMDVPQLAKEVSAANAAVAARGNWH